MKTTFLAITTSIYLLLLVSLPATVLGRSTTITASGDIGTSYESNVYHSKSNTISEWNSYISPTFLYSSVDIHNDLLISYNPTYSYNHRRSTHTLTHELDAVFTQQVSDKFNFNFTNNFSYTDAPGAETTNASLAMNFIRINPNQQEAIATLLFYDISWPGGNFDPMNPAQVAFVMSELQIRYAAASPEIQTEVDGILHQSTDKNQFWSNFASFNGFYHYGKDNLVSFGYSYTKRQNNANYLGEEDTHQPFFSIQHTLSKKLKVSLSYDFTNTSRELSDDSTSHVTTLRTTYSFNHAQQAYIEYSNEQMRFAGQQSDQVAHRFDLDYTHHFNPQTTFDIAVAPFQINRNNTGDERGYALSTTLARNMKNSQIILEVRHDTSDLDTTGSWKPFRKTWLARTNVNHHFTQNLTTDLFISYDQTESWNNNAKNKYLTYTGGINTTYPLNKWLDLELEYRYTLLNSNNIQIEDSTNNKVILRLSAANDFWR